MAAYPFQSFPTFAEYCNWLRSEGGHAEQRDTNRWGQFTLPVSPDGRKLIPVAGIEQDEGVAPNMLQFLDSRLGLVSPWTARHPHLPS